VNRFTAMNRTPLPEDESWESDAVWKLLDEAPPAAARPRFVDDVMRAVRLEETPQPWWKRLFAPLPVAGLATATAAIALAVHSLVSVPTTGHSPVVVTPAIESFAEVQDAADAEVLVAAADHLDQFSDNELVSLIGF
jgi:hypothetical protein